MNLEELQIKIGIELKELNKQLKKASDDINDVLGPKATKKMMQDNNKVVKDGFKDMEKTAKTSAKQMRKEVAKEFESMSKDISKSLNKAFELDMSKFNKNLTQSMNDAKTTVRSTCNDIRRELNAALNIKANVRVNSSVSSSGSSATSRTSDAAAIMQSSQYTGAMITKAVNEMIRANNANTARLESSIRRIESALVSEFSKLSAKTQASNEKARTTGSNKKAATTEHKVNVKADVETSVKVVESDLQSEVNKAINSLDVSDIKTSIVLDENIKDEVEKAVNSVKTEDIKLKADLETNIKLNADELQNDANKAIREVITRDIEASIKVSKDNLQDEVDSAIQAIDVPELSAIVELDEHLQNDVNKAVREVSVPDFRTAIRLSESSQIELQSEINNLISKVDVPNLIASFKVDDSALQSKVNESIEGVKEPDIAQGTSSANSEMADLLKEQIASLDIKDILGMNSSYIDEIMKSLEAIPKLMAPKNDSSLLPVLTEAQKRFNGIKETMKGVSLQEVLGKTSFDLTKVEALEQLLNSLPSGVSKAKVIMELLTEAVKELGFESVEAYAKFNKLMGIDPLAGNKKQKPQRPDGFIPKQGIPGQVTKPQRPDGYNPIQGVEKTLSSEIIDVDAIKSVTSKAIKEFDDIRSELRSLDFKVIEESLIDIGDYVEPLKKQLEPVTKELLKVEAIDDEKISLNLDASDAKNQLRIIHEMYEDLIETCKTNNLNELKKALGVPEQAGSGQYPPAPPKKHTGTSNKEGGPSRPKFDYSSNRQRFNRPPEDYLSITSDDSDRFLEQIKKMKEDIDRRLKEDPIKFEMETNENLRKIFTREQVEKMLGVDKADEIFGKVVEEAKKAASDINKQTPDPNSGLPAVVDTTVDDKFDGIRKDIEDAYSKLQTFNKAIAELFQLLQNKADITEGAIKDLFDSATRIGQTPVDVKLQTGEDNIKAVQDGMEQTLESYNRLKAALGMPIKDIIIGSDIQALKAAEERLFAIKDAYADLAKMDNNALREAFAGTGFSLDEAYAEAEELQNSIKNALDDPAATKDDKKLGKGLLKDIETVQKKIKELQDEDIKIQAEIEAQINAEAMELSFKKTFAQASLDAAKNNKPVDITPANFEEFKNAYLKAAMEAARGASQIPVEFQVIAKGAENLRGLFDLPEFKEHAEALRDILKGIDLGDDLKVNLDLDELLKKLKSIQSIDDIDIDLSDLRTDLIKLAEEADKMRSETEDEIEIKVIDDEVAKITELLKLLDKIQSQYNIRINAGGSDGLDGGDGGNGGDRPRRRGRLPGSGDFTTGRRPPRPGSFMDSGRLPSSGAFTLFASPGPMKLHKVLTQLEQKVIKVFNKIKAVVASVVTPIITPFKNAFNRVMTIVKNVASKISTTFKSAMTKVSTTVKNYGAVIKYHLNKAFDGIKSTKLYSKVASGLNKAKGAVSKFASATRTILGKAFDGIKIGAKVAKGIASGLNKAKGVLSKFANSCKTLWGKIKQIFSKGANDASKATGKLTSGLKALLAQALGFFSLYGLINLGKQAIQQSGMLAQSEVKLTALMKQRMGATNETVRAIRELAKEQANLGVVSEAAMVRGAEQLSMYVHSAKALQTLMPAIANMTARRGGFNATEDDAMEIATQLGEAIREGTTTPLEQSGIYLSEAEIKKFQALRTEEERAAYLADVIAKNVGNINEALANTPHGQIAQLKNNFKSLLGTLGTLLVNVIQPIVKWLNVIVVAANNALKALGELLGFDMTGGGLAGVDLGTGSTGTDTSGIDGATDSLEDAKDAAGEAEEAVEKFKGSLMGFDEINILSDNTNKDSSEEDDPTNITPGEGGQLDPGEYLPTDMTEGENIFTKFGEKMKAFMDEVLEPFKAAWDELGDRWKTAWADLVDSFGNACNSLANFLKSVWDNGGKEFVQHLAEIGLACGIAAMEIGGTILDALAKLWDHLDPEKNMHTQRLLDVLNEVSVKLRDFILGLNEHLENLLEYGGQDVLNAMGDCFMDLAAAAVNSFGVIIDAVDGLIDHLDPKFNQDTRNMLQATADMFHATGQAAWDFSELLRSSLENGGQDLINALGTCFVNLGETIARVITTAMESLSEFFDYIDPAKNDITREMMKSWEEAFYAIGDAALEFADLFESVMNNGGQEVLNKLGDAFNSLVGLVGDCVKEIADALDGLFEHLDPKTNQFTQDMLSAWERAFEDIADMCDSLSDLIGSAMDNGGQELVNSVGDLGMKLGEAFGVVVEECAETFSGLFDHMNPENNEHSKKMMDALDGLVDSITEFVDACVEAFQKFMDNGGREIVNNLGDILAIVIDLAAELGSGIIDIITGFMNSWVGQTLIEGVAQALEWVTDKLVGLSDAFDVVKDIFQNIVDIIVGVFEGDGEKVGKAFANLIKNAFKLTGELLQWLWDIGCDIVEGLVKGICALPELLWDAVQFIFDTIVSFFKELFGIHSPSTVFAELGEFLIEGLAQGITDCVNSVKDAFKKIGDAISDATKEIKEAVSEKFKEIKDDIKEKLKETKEVVSEKWGEIKTTVSEKAKETYEAAKEKWKNIKDTVSDRSKETYETVKEKFGDIYNTVKDKAGDTYEKVSESWTKMKEDAGKKLEQIKTDAEKKYDQVKSSLVKKIGEVKTETVNKWNEVKDSTIEGIEKVREKAEEKYESIKETMTRKLEQIKSTTSSKWEEIKKDTADKVESLRTTAEEKYDSLKEKLLTKLENTKASMGSKWDAIKSEAVKKCGEMATEAHNKFSDIKGKFTSKMDEIKSTLGPKWDNLKSQASTKASEIATKAGEGFDNISSKASKALESAREGVSKGLSKISSLFKNTSWSLPKIKMPHFSISGSFSLNPPSVPKFGVEWYKRGGIIDGITPLGFTGGTMHVGGEAGKEMVVPLENTSFTSKIAKAMGQAVDNALARNFNNSSNGDSPYVNDSRDVVLQVDGREFARASINSINKLQRESGRTLLDI